MNAKFRAARALRALIPAAAVAAALTLSGPASAAEPASPVTATYFGAGVGYNKVLDGHAAGTLELTVGEHTAEAFCIQYGVGIDQTGTYQQQTWAEAGTAGLAQAADIATRHAAIGQALPDPKSENAAAQLAIWHYTDSVDFSTVPNASIVTRASELVAAAGQATEPAPPADMAVTQTQSGATTTVTAKTGSGTPVAFTFDGKTTTVTADQSGSATTSVATPTTAADMTVAATVAVPAGTVFAPASGQAMLTVSAASATRTTTIQIAAAAAAATTAAATTHPAETTPVTSSPVRSTSKTPAAVSTKATATVTKTPVATTSTNAAVPVVKNHQAPPKQLPYTGGWVEPWMFILAAAVAAAGIAFQVRRRVSAKH